MSLLSAIFLVPLLAAVLVLFIPRSIRWGIRLVALAATLVSLVLALVLFCQYGSAESVNGYRFDYVAPWVNLDMPALDLKLVINYHVGVDGINLGLLVMGALVAFAATCLSKEINRLEKEFYLLLLVMTGGILGAFASLNLFFFYFFHELALVPTFIMIGVWGRGENRNYATFKITLYLSVGALIALVGLIALYLQSGAKTFDLVELTEHVRRQPIPPASQSLIFPLLLFGFGILVSLWPFHTWAPLGYAAAPTATAMLHAGVLKKFGLYGLLRVAIPLVPEGAAAWLEVLAVLCLGNILFVGLVAIRQKDFNLLIGNASVAHMGFVFLGIASLSLVGVTGAVVLMVAHGLLAALTFGLSGWLRQQTGTLEMEKLGGLLHQVPFAGTAILLAALAGCGLPGFGNFVGEAMVLFGSWQSFPVVTVLAVYGALVIGAVYMLRAVRSILHGPVPAHLAGVTEAPVLHDAEITWQGASTGGEANPLLAAGALATFQLHSLLAGPLNLAWRRLPYCLLLGGLLLLGVYPRLLTDKVRPSVEGVLELARTPQREAAPVPAAEARAPKPGGTGRPAAH